MTRELTGVGGAVGGEEVQGVLQLLVVSDLVGILQHAPPGGGENGCTHGGCERHLDGCGVTGVHGVAFICGAAGDCGGVGDDGEERDGATLGGAAGSAVYFAALSDEALDGDLVEFCEEMPSQWGQ